MASKRMVSRRSAISKKIARISWQADALYHRTLAFLDDAGRITADPEDYRAQVIPKGKYGKAVPLTRIESIIQELYQAGLIGLCECPGGRCMEYKDFGKFNIIRSDREKQVECKEPVGFHWMSWNDKTCESAPILTEVNLTKPNLTAQGAEGYSPEFESFWKLYPRKIEKPKAFKCWQARLKEGEKPTRLKVCADNYAGTCIALKTEPQFIKHPATFLGRDRPYEDYRVSVPVEIEEPVKTDINGNPLVHIDHADGTGEWITGKEFDELRGAGKVIYKDGKWMRVEGELCQ
jgi:hypothetical protein